MRVVFFVHCFFPSHFYGTETYTLDLAKYYQEVGYQVAVISAIFQGETRQEELIERYEFQGVPVLSIDKNRLPHTCVKETYYQPEMRETLRRVLEELKPDVVHVTHLINHTAVLLEVTHDMGIPTYATFTDFFGFCFNNKLEAANGDLCSGPSVSRSNCVACYLKAAAGSASGGWMKHANNARKAQALARLLGWLRYLPGLSNSPIKGLVEDIAQRPGTLANLYNRAYRAAVAPTHFLASAYQANGIRVPMHAIHFGVDIDRRPKPKRDLGHLPVIGFIGQIAPHKGTDLLLSAFRRLPKGVAFLHIYGPSDQDPHYMRQLEEQAQGVAVEFKGTFGKERMADVLASIDLLAIPSRWYENSPLVLLNALATHTPVLVADVAGMTEFLKPGVNGYAFERGNAEHLYQRLCDLVLEPNILYRMSQTTAYERTPSMMAEETLALYSASGSAPSHC